VADADENGVETIAMSAFGVTSEPPVLLHVADHGATLELVFDEGCEPALVARVEHAQRLGVIVAAVAVVVKDALWLEAGDGRHARCWRAVLSTEPSVSLGVERGEWERIFHVSPMRHVGLRGGSR
jgi:hypothetical protein